MTKFPAEVEATLEQWLESMNKELTFDQAYLESLVNKPGATNEPVDDRIESLGVRMNQDYRDCVNSSEAYLLTKKMRTLGEFVANSVGTDQDLAMNDESFLRGLNTLDIVTCSSTRSNCFTKK